MVEGEYNSEKVTSRHFIAATTVSGLNFYACNVITLLNSKIAVYLGFVERLSSKLPII